MIDLTMWHSIPEEENAGNSWLFLTALFVKIYADDTVCWAASSEGDVWRGAAV